MAFNLKTKEKYYTLRIEVEGLMLVGINST